MTRKDVIYLCKRIVKFFRKNDWCKGTAFRDKEGKPTIIEKACSFCAIGAVQRMYRANGGIIASFVDAFEHFTGGRNIVVMNDDCNSKKQFISRLKFVIGTLETGDKYAEKN